MFTFTFPLIRIQSPSCFLFVIIFSLSLPYSSLKSVSPFISLPLQMKFHGVLFFILSLTSSLNPFVPMSICYTCSASSQLISSSNLRCSFFKTWDMLEAVTQHTLMQVCSIQCQGVCYALTFPLTLSHSSQASISTLLSSFSMDNLI